MTSRILVPGLKVAVSVLLIWLAFRNLDLREVWTRLFDIPLSVLALAIAMFLVQIVICALRWRAVVLAIGSEISVLQALIFFWIGAFFNQALPSSVGGDAVRIYKVYKAGGRLDLAASGVILERGATVYGLVIVVTVMLPFLAGEVSPGDAEWIMPGVLGLFGLSTFGLATVMVLDRIPQSLHRWRLFRGLAVIAADARSVFLRPANAARVLSWSVVGHANICVVIYALLIGLGEGVSFATVLGLFPLVVLATTIPISIAGWGVREVSMIATFALVGVSNEGATVASLMFGFVSAITSLPGGAIWLLEGSRHGGPRVPPSLPAADKGTS